MRLPALFVVLVSWAYAQSPQVPSKMNFAGMTLHIKEDARKEIQKDVDALTQYPKYFQIKVDRAKTYFPIIEKIFAEERLPDDFKYLVLQESALIADAVSTSNAVGFWQFKDFTAMEMGLRVDKEIDERMNIVSSSRAAAQYLKKNNFYFNNWLFALQSYQMGAGGVMRSVSNVESGATQMDITSGTYWYVKKYLAHKVAFESAVNGSPVVTVVPYEIKEKKHIHEIAKEFSISNEMMEEYNKWVRKGTIPDDKLYAVAIPVQGDTRQVYALVNKHAADQRPAAEQVKHTHKSETKQASPAIVTDKKFIHGLPAIKAEAGETSSALASRGGIALSKFLAVNDLTVSDPLQPGQYYYLKKKKAKSAADKHTVAGNDETLWSVSQQYGVQLKPVKKLNPGLTARKLKPGTIVALPAGIRPSGNTEVAAVPAVELETGEFFNWTIQPEQSVISTSSGSGMAEPPSVNPRDLSSSIQQGVQVISASVYGSTPADTNRASQPISGSPISTEIVAAGEGQHMVVAGETLYALSKRYQVGVMDLVNWNQLSLQDGIKTGQVLLVKDPESARSEENLPTPQTNPGAGDQFIVYVVKPSDTLYSVARQYNVTIKDLMDWNRKTDFNVAVGEKLRIQQK